MTSAPISAPSHPDLFEARRRRLQQIAYRVLGDVWEAEDAVQDTWLKFRATSLEEIRNVDAWLTTAVSRAAIDAGRRMRWHTTATLDDEDGDTIGDVREADTDPERLVLEEDEVSAAFAIVLAELTPVERLSFLLHDVFGYSFAEIAEIAETTEAVAKKRASRARRRLRDRDWERIRRRQREHVAAFLDAARNGNMADLIAVLDPEVRLHADETAVALASRSRQENAPLLAADVQGAAAVAAALSKRIDDAVLIAFDALTAVGYARPGEEVRAAYVLRMRGGKVSRIDAVADPEILRTFVSGTTG